MPKPGTSLCAPEFASGVAYILNDAAGDALIVKCATGDIPTGVAGYAVGCLLINTSSGVLYINTGAGTKLSCAFAAV